MERDAGDEEATEHQRRDRGGADLGKKQARRVAKAEIQE